MHSGHCLVLDSRVQLQQPALPPSPSPVPHAAPPIPVHPFSFQASISGPWLTRGTHIRIGHNTGASRDSASPTGLTICVISVR
jgi:hypothetical protein